MSRLDELIATTCPNGVEHKPLSELATIQRGVRVVRKQLSAEGEYPVYQNSLTPLGYHTEKNCEAGTTFVICAGAAGDVGFSNVDFWAADDCHYIKSTEKLLSRYLYHILLWQQPYLYSQVRRGSIPRLSRMILEKIKVPVPPLPVQREIVRILDNFMELIAELTAELTARKRQYEYYKKNLLSCDRTETITLAELFDTRNGFTPSKNNNHFWENGDVPWFRMEDIRTNGRILSDALQRVTTEAAKNKPFPAGSIIVSTSATIGEHALILCDFLSNQRFTCLSIKSQYKPMFDIRFLFYYCFILDEYCLNNLNQGNFASVDMSKFNRFEFPIIPLEKQKEIVNILERFDVLCNDITTGLPAEIAARQKQYEYYRDKLLTFKKLA